MSRFGIEHRTGLSALFPRVNFQLPVEIGENTYIWDFASVMRDAAIGDDCTIGQGAHVGPHVQIGNRCKIQNGAQLFQGVTLEDDVFIGPHVVFTNVLTPRAFVNRHTAFKPTVVQVGASIGANATILCGITIGQYALIGAGSVVTKDVAPHSVVVGNPAKHLAWACHCGETLPEDRLDLGRLLCSTCGNRYRIRSNEVSLVEEKQPHGQSGSAP